MATLTNSLYDRLANYDVLQVDIESGMVRVGLFLILVDVVLPVLSKCGELPYVVEYPMILLLKVKELLQLGVKQTRR
jgi:hypothetical protein